MPSEFAQLNAHRLARDWTWAQLSAAMTARGLAMSPRTLHYLLKQMPADATPTDRTLYKVRAYLKHVRSAERRRAARRKAAPKFHVELGQVS